MARSVFTIFGEVALRDKATQKLDEVTKKGRDTADNLAKNADKIGASWERNISGLASGIGSASLSLASGFNNLSSSITSMATSAGSALSSVGNSITNYITKPALAAGSALAATTLFKGWNRITTIDNATVKLKALGNTAKDVGQIIANANEAVTGTVHGLDEALSVAAQASASGIKSGQEMETYLRRVADAASFAEISMGDMGSIFNKVLTGGRAQAEELNQLANRGIPIFQMLADSMGVSTDQVRELAAEGEVTADVLMEAFDNIEGYAKDGAKNFGGAWSLAMSSIARTGANLFGQVDKQTGEVTGLLSILKDMLISVRDVLVPIESLASDAGKALADMAEKPAKKLKEFADNWKDLDKSSQKSILKQIAGMAGMAVILGPVMTIMGKMLAIGGKVGGVFTGAGASLVKFAKATKSGTGAVSKFSKGLTTLGGKIPKYTGLFTGLSKNLTGVATAISGVLSVLSSLTGLGFVMVAIGGIVAGLGLIPESMRNALSDTLATVREKAPQILSELGDKLVNQIPTLISNGASLITDVFDTLTSIMPDLSMLGQNILNGIIEGMQNNGEAIFTSVIGFIMSLGQAFIDNLPLIIELGALFIEQLAKAFENNAEEIGQMAGDLLVALKDAIVENKDKLLNAGKAIINGIITAFTSSEELMTAGAIILLLLFGKALITQALTSLIPAGLKLVGTLLTGILSGKVLIIAGVIAIIGWIVKKLVDNWDTIKQEGINLFNKLKDGLTEAWDNIKEWFSSAKDFFKDKLGEVDLVQIGKNIIDGLKEGLMDAWEGLKSWFGARMDDLKGMAQSILSIFSPSRFFEWIGEMIFKGLGIGLEDEYKNVDKIMSSSLEDLINQANYLSGLVGFTNGYNQNSFPTHQQAYDPTAINLEEMIYLLRQIADKDISIYIDGREVSKAIHDPLSDYSNTYNIMQNRMKGAW